jgi:hypothetical protein
VWESDVQLIIGWGDFVKVGRVKQRTEASAHGLPSRYVEIVAMYTQFSFLSYVPLKIPFNSFVLSVLSFRFRTEYIISGIAPFGNDLVILSYSEAEDNNSNQKTNPNTNSSIKGSEPELRIVTRDNAELSLDVLSIQGFENYRVIIPFSRTCLKMFTLIHQFSISSSLRS